MKVKTSFYYLLLIFGLFSCDDDAGPLVQCAAIDYAIPGLLVEITDINGTNLLDNGTYNTAEVKVVIGDTNFSRIMEGEDGTVINILLSNAINNKDAQVILSTTETDILRVQLTQNTTGFPCFFPIFKVEEARYNGIDLTVEQLPFNQKVSIIK
jgi:hypothetical protein